MAQNMSTYPFPYSQAAQLDPRIKISRPAIDPALAPIIDSCLLPEELDLGLMRNYPAGDEGETVANQSESIINGAPHLKLTEFLVPGPQGNDGLVLSVFMPKESTSAALPALYHIHGGGMVAGDRFSGVTELLDIMKGIECVFLSVEIGRAHV